MKWGLVGYGSIAKRHAANILSAGDQVIIVSIRNECDFPKVGTIKELIDLHNPDIILICNATSAHKNSYLEIRSLSSEVPILIEKPIFDRRYDLEKDPNTFVAYCLRFHPLIMKLRQKIQNQNVISARFYVGQYLPEWRENRDYRTSYSSKIELGGGVLRDLSHEIDLAYHLFGDLTLEFSKSGKFSDLDITSDDLFVGFFNSQKCSNVLIEMNYLDRISQRHLTVFTNEETIQVNFINGTIATNRDIEKIEYEKDEMYLAMLCGMREKKYENFSKFDEGLKILDIISQVEKKQ